MEMGGFFKCQINICRSALTLPDTMKSDSKSWKDLEKVLPPSMTAVVTAQAALLPSKPCDAGATALGRAHTCLRFCLSVLLLPHLYSKCSRRTSGAGITWGLSEMQTCLLMEPRGASEGLENTRSSP